MNVYMNNELAKTESLLSANVDEYSKMEYLYHPYLELPAEFKSIYAEVTGKWAINNPAQIDSLIIANTNVKTYRIVFYDQNDAEVYDTGLITIFEPIQITKLQEKFLAYSFRATFTADGPVSIGLLYIGAEKVFPRFIVAPVKDMAFRGETNRTMGGQSYGIFQQPLEAFGISFVRIENEVKEMIREYMKAVTNVVPHVVDFYPKAHEEFPPMYVTLAEGFSATKREENHFYWNFNLAYQEAR